MKWLLMRRTDGGTPLLVNLERTDYIMALPNRPGGLFVSNCSYSLIGEVEDLARMLEALNAPSVAGAAVAVEDEAAAC